MEIRLQAAIHTARAGIARQLFANLNPSGHEKTNAISPDSINNFGFLRLHFARSYSSFLQVGDLPE
ncbi:hypothetical protein [Hymenobacter volaticus]|uniref:Uncharacterized protein n=1 Tax=Hymenobacter volaticus TaxID=2932254 RepID=A0ABY4GCJ8_9BACT|nr:hypothetical protein [Hymenobacter volaticus]UOQ68631.1 hypothetical protein MUN86_24330 [Hymenobacter volaticus]